MGAGSGRQDPESGLGSQLHSRGSATAMKNTPLTPEELARFNAPRVPFRERASQVGISAIVLAIVVSLFLGGWWLFSTVGTWLSYEPTWQWWGGAYFICGVILASLSWLAIFGSVWWWSAERWGGICFVLGWIPSGIIATICWPLIAFLWGIALLGWWAFTAIRDS
jgi:hypothetical protein